MTSEPVFSKSFIATIVLGVLFILIFLDLPLLCESQGHHHHGHSHEEFDHGHSHEHVPNESPSFKYSKQANDMYESDKGSHKVDKAHINGGREERDTYTLWVNAIGSTVLISAAPFFILFLVPLDNTKEKEPLLKILLSFASGSLLGDAFLHLIPHALMAHSHEGEHAHSHSHSHSHSHGEGEHGHGHDMVVGFWVLFGVIAFLMVEKFVRLVKGGHGHSHGHSHEEKKKKTDNDTKKSEKKESSSSESEDKAKEKQENSQEGKHLGVLR